MLGFGEYKVQAKRSEVGPDIFHKFESYGKYSPDGQITFGLSPANNSQVTGVLQLQVLLCHLGVNLS